MFLLTAYPMFLSNYLNLLALQVSVRELSVCREAPYMQAETQNQAVVASENAPSDDSTPIKKQHGGKRTGAGRPPNLLKRMIGRLKPAGAAELLAGIDVEATIAEIMKKGSLPLKQRTLADLMDRAWGRPAQAVSVSGSVVHAHWTPGKYSHLTDEEFAKLAELSAKALGPPASNTPQDGRGFQDKSTIAIEAQIVDSEAIGASES
jgi:hypothetical protein